MSKWGLTDDLIEEEPWGIPAELLLPAKTNTDPVHEAVYLNKLECAIIDTEPFQRLRRVRQLGTTHLIYPAVLAAALDDHGMAELGDHGLAGLGGDIDTTPLSGRRATTPCRWREVVAVTPG